jgi:hypothetical protein
MGMINHNVVVATTWSREAEEKVEAFVNSLPLPTRQLFVWTDGLYNGYTTVVMIPDGSKEGHQASDGFDNVRDRFVAELESMDYSDGSSPWQWVEIGYGEFGQKILRGNNCNCYGDGSYYVPE